MTHQTAKLLSAVAAIALLAGGAAAQDYPTRQINLIIPHGAGSSADIGGRIVADELSQRIGQNIIVENREGAGSTIGMDYALRQQPDGYTIVLVAISNTINHNLQDQLPFDVTTDVQGISAGWSAPNVAALNADIPVTNLQEFIELVQERPQGFDYATAGNGTSQHFSGELLKMLTGLDLEHVPYSVGTQAISDALGGQEILVFNSAPGLQSHIESGGLRPIGVTSSVRSPILPDVPTFAEQGLEGYDVSAWWGFAASSEVPEEIIGFLSTEIQAVIDSEKVQAQFARLGATASGSTPEAYNAFIAAEVEKYRGLIEAAGL